MDINVIELAYLGDAFYELKVREYLIKKGIRKVDNLQKSSVNYVSAKAQANILKCIMDNLTPKEIDIIHRARNYKRNTHPKNTDILTYNNVDRIDDLLKDIWRN